MCGVPVMTLLQGAQLVKSGFPDRPQPSQPVKFSLTEMPYSRNSGIWALIGSLWSQLSRRRHRQLVLVLGLMVLSALAEVVTLGAVLPFIGVLAAPERVYSYPLVSSFVDVLGIETVDDLVLPFTVAFVLAALLAGIIRLSLLWISNRLAVVIGADLSGELYRRHLYQPYSVHLVHSSSEMISGISTKINVVAGVILAMLSLVSSLWLIVSVVIALMLIDPVVATVGIVVFGGSYTTVTLLFRRQLLHNSLVEAEEQTRVVKCVQEGTGGIRDILLDGTQPFLVGEFKSVDRRLRLAGGNTTFISSSPRYVMEAMGMVLIAVLAYGMSRQVGGLATGLPVLAALAIGGQRLLPALQQSYANWTKILGSQVVVAEVIDLLGQPIPDWVGEQSLEPAQFKKSLELDSVSFRYTPDGPPILEDLNMKIQMGTTVGFVGSTGSGKTTALDLLTGLLEPTSGSVLVDGIPVAGTRRQSWQRTVAYVPQAVFLADASMAENIAFGIRPAEVDMIRVRESARGAAIADFIESEPDGYDTRVGERGIRLSGGQRQRVGIARALYKRASVLVLDEAMSALDPETERMVIDSIACLRGDITVVLVSHRLRTVAHCDIVYQFAEGRLVAQGTLEGLLSNNSRFRQMADLVD